LDKIAILSNKKAGVFIPKTLLKNLSLPPGDIKYQKNKNSKNIIVANNDTNLYRFSNCGLLERLLQCVQHFSHRQTTKYIFTIM